MASDIEKLSFISKNLMFPNQTPHDAICVAEAIERPQDNSSAHGFQNAEGIPNRRPSVDGHVRVIAYLI